MRDLIAIVWRCARAVLPRRAGLPTRPHAGTGLDTVRGVDLEGPATGAECHLSI
jgi:hypothetical protein